MEIILTPFADACLHKMDAQPARQEKTESKTFEVKESTTHSHLRALESYVFF